MSRTVRCRGRDIGGPQAGEWESLCRVPTSQKGLRSAGGPKLLGSVRTEVVHFVGFGGLATSLAPGRGTYGLVRSAAFQGCKDRRKILKWRHMRAFSGSVSEWCGRADAARLLPQQPPSDRAASARTQAASAPAAAWRPGSIRLAAGRMLRRLLPRQTVAASRRPRMAREVSLGKRPPWSRLSLPHRCPRTLWGPSRAPAPFPRGSAGPRSCRSPRAGR